MLQDVRRGMQGTTAKVIVWSIAITFALFGVESIVGGIGGEPDVAEVNGEGIPESEFAVAVERKKRQVLAQMGEAADPALIDDALLSKSVLDGLIQEKTLEQDSSEKGLFLSTSMVDEYIRGMQEFQVDGEFSQQRMQNVLGSAGFTLNSFRLSLAKQVLIDQTRAALIGSAFVLDNEKDKLLELDRQTRTFGMAILPAENYLDEVSVSDAEAENYYNENKNSFTQPESVDIEYVVLDKSSLDAGEIPSEDIEARYELELQDFAGEEERRAAHILISITDELDEAAALEKASELKARIDAGDDFAEIAKAESQDEGSATEGGDLGFSAKGVYVSGFEDALFALNEGEVSEPVKTEFGYHIIKLLAVQVNEPPTLAERAPSIEEELKSEKLDTLFVDLSQQLADISYSSPGLEESAEELGLEIKELFAVSRNSQDVTFSDLRVQRALFDPENLSGENNSELIELEDGKALVFNVRAYNEESIKEFGQVKTEVVEALQAEKASAYAASIGSAFMVRAKTGEQPGLVATDIGLDWEEKSGVRRDDFSVTPDLLFKVFAMEHPESGQPRIGGFELASGDFAVAALESVAGGDPSDVTMIEVQSIKSSLSASYGGTDYSTYLRSLESSAEVETL